jgi:hypothetical protein
MGKTLTPIEVGCVMSSVLKEWKSADFWVAPDEIIVKPGSVKKWTHEQLLESVKITLEGGSKKGTRVKDLLLQLASRDGVKTYMEEVSELVRESDASWEGWKKAVLEALAKARGELLKRHFIMESSETRRVKDDTEMYVIDGNGAMLFTQKGVVTSDATHLLVGKHHAVKDDLDRTGSEPQYRWRTIYVPEANEETMLVLRHGATRIVNMGKAEGEVSMVYKLFITLWGVCTFCLLGSCGKGTECDWERITKESCKRVMKVIEKGGEIARKDEERKAEGGRVVNPNVEKAIALRAMVDACVIKSDNEKKHGHAVVRDLGGTFDENSNSSSSSNGGGGDDSSGGGGGSSGSSDSNSSSSSSGGGSSGSSDSSSSSSGGGSSGSSDSNSNSSSSGSSGSSDSNSSSSSSSSSGGSSSNGDGDSGSSGSSAVSKSCNSYNARNDDGGYVATLAPLVSGQQFHAAKAAKPARKGVAAASE